MKSKFFGLSAKLAFAVLAVGAMFTSCYEKEEIDVTPAVKPEPAKYVIVGNVTDLNTGKALVAAVTIDDAAVTVNENGYFEKNGLTAGSHVVKAVKDNYINAVKTVYLPETAAGGTCVVSADFALADVNSQVVEPSKEPEPAKKEDMENLKNDNIGMIINAFAGIKDITAEDLVIDPVTGKATLTVEQTDVPVVGDGEPLVVELPYFTGFASTVTPESDGIFTKAVKDGQIWLASASKALGREYGLKEGAREAKIDGVLGMTIAGYKLTIVFLNEVYVFNGAEGTVMYQTEWKVEPVYESHDSHDSHDSHNAHGGNPGAGGGSGK